MYINDHKRSVTKYILPVNSQKFRNTVFYTIFMRALSDLKS
jgi:hypothetical protein